MKKLCALLILTIIFISCKQEKPVIIDGVDYKKAIIGKWEAVKLGKIMKQFKYELPSRFEFKENGDYYYLYTKFGVRNERWGEYELDLDRRPVEINFNQEKPKNALMQGIIRFISKDKMHLIFYYKNVMPRVYKFTENEYQVYKKVTQYTPQR